MRQKTIFSFILLSSYASQFLIILIINKVSKISTVSEATYLATIFLSHVSNCLHILITFKQYEKTTSYTNKYKCNKIYGCLYF